MKLIFAGTPEFARQALADLHAAGHDIALVMTQPDRPAGRGMKLQASPVKQWAVEHGIPVAQPQGLKLDGKYAPDAAQAQALILGTQADAMVVAAYGLILPQWVLDAPRLGCLNIHASLLPRWRGAAPIHRAIEAGDATTGITIMQMDAGLDTGDMLMTAETPIQANDTTASLHDRLAELGGRMIVQTLAAAQAGQLSAGLAQPEAGVTYAHKIEKSESAIDWRLPASMIERRIRAFDPFPGCTLRWGVEGSTNVEIIKVWQAQLVDAMHATGPAGALLDADECVVACGEQSLLLQVVQRPGGKRISGKALMTSMDLKILPSSSSDEAQRGAPTGHVSRLV
jgi:methionyl-tRNA formyltransferase